MNQNQIIIFAPSLKLLFGLLLFGVALTVGGLATTVQAQTAIDGFDPNPDGTIRAIVVQPDGKIIIGGDFTAVAPNGGASVTRNHLARFNSDGTLDTVFDPNANDAVLALALQADGKVLVGGQFGGPNSIGGQSRSYIARLDPTTGAADSFDPNANSDVFAIAVQPDDNKILVGGAFSGANSIGGQSRNRIARIDPTTGLADSFDPNASSNVLVVAIQPQDHKILVGGQFTGANSIGGQSRNGIARLDPNTGLADSFDPIANGDVWTLAQQADGKIIVAGGFNGANSIGGQARNYLARLDPTTGLADSFDPNANGLVYAITVQADGKMLVGGAFNGANSIGGQSRNYLARLDSATGLADSFDPNANGDVLVFAQQADGKILSGGIFNTVNGATRNYFVRLERNGLVDQALDLNIAGSTTIVATAVQPDGKIIIAGTFTNVLGTTRNRIARLNTDGTLDTAFDPNINARVLSINVQANGKILVGGEFTALTPNGGSTVARSYLVRLEADGTVDSSFDPNFNNGVYATAVQADGKILVSGYFTALAPNGGSTVTRSYLARIEADGTVDSAFNSNVNNEVYSMALQADGKILIIGYFTALAPNGGSTVTRNHIARLEITGAVDTGFDPNANNDVNSVAVQADGKILIGGIFTALAPNGGATVTRNRIARLNSDGTLDTGFNPNANSNVDTILVQADGRILISGFFTTLAPNGGSTVTRNRIARLESSGLLDTLFNPNSNGYIQSTALQTDGKILVGGTFSAVNGQTRSRFARLSNNEAALQNLSATQSSITWTRGGSAIEFERVTFESSTDGNTFSVLGNAARIGTTADWTLTGISLPANQNLYLRARGFARSGYLNSSGGIVESVRNFYFAGPTSALVTIGGRVLSNGNSGGKSGKSLKGGFGRGIARARVTLTDPSGNLRTTFTNSFGYYRFAEVVTGATYVIEVKNKRYSFATQVFYISEESTDFDFIALF